LNTANVRLGAPDYVEYVTSGGRPDKVKYETEVKKAGEKGPQDVMISYVKATH
jgi:hypothetical protein